MRQKRNKTLTSKFVIGFILLAITICITTCLIGYNKYKSTIEKMYNDTAYAVAKVAATYIDGNTIADYIQTNVKDEKYNEMGKQIDALLDNSGSAFIYIFVPHEDNTFTIIYDAKSANSTLKPYELGSVDKISIDAKDVLNIYKTGKRMPNYFMRVSETWGDLTSAILPIKNDAGEITALVNVDISTKTIDSTLYEYVTSVIFISSFLVLIFILNYLFYLKRTVVAPIKLITNEADRFINEKTKISTLLSSINTRDEIELLAKSLKKMEIDINSYIGNLATVTAEKERISAELNVAAQIQSDMLPKVFPAFPQRSEFDIFATMQPAKEVGGDFYDFFLIDDDHLAVIVADASGKGVPAALFVVITKTLIKNNTKSGIAPADVFTLVNNELCENNESCFFVTAWMGILEIHTGRFTYVNAGHNPPMLKHQNGGYEYLTCDAGFLLGAMENIEYSQGEMMMHKGDILYMYTDGVTEASDIDRKLYGEKRLRKVLNENSALALNELLPAIRADIDIFVKGAPQFDDITMLALKII